MNSIFACGDVVLRVAAPSVPAVASLDLSEFLLQHGVRVPAPRRDDVVEHQGLSVTAWEHIIASGEPVDWSAVGAMVRQIHALDPTSLPVRVPLPQPSALPWWDFDSLLARADSALDTAAHDGLRAAVDRHRGWRKFSDSVVCHGDVHPGNVMMAASGPVLLDWDLLCWAPCGWDHAPLLTWHDRWGGDEHTYDTYSIGYGRSLSDDPAALAFAELRLVAATLMRVVAGLTDERARGEAERRLRYWRGERDAPVWTVQ